MLLFCIAKGMEHFILSQVGHFCPGVDKEILCDGVKEFGKGEGGSFAPSRTPLPQSLHLYGL